MRIKTIAKIFLQRISKTEKEILKNINDKFPEVLSTAETIQLIVSQKASISRFGDGEFDICNQENKLDPYQNPSNELTNRLTEILSYKGSDNVIICIPPFNSNYNNIKNYFGKLSFWEWYWLKKYKNIAPLLKNDNYGNSFVSRDAVFYENNINIIQEIWSNRDVVFVYGEGGRFDINSPLFDNVSSKKTILISPTNAFSDYKNTLKKCLLEKMDSLFLIAAGPTATVLAFDLSKEGIQALDVGHLTNCYEQYLGIITSPESLPLIKKDTRG
ncbi:GT-D fold domain-containing glycosyltransferase [Paenibacillus sp. FSL H8-0048]|uniref:GT-D fold domain-containing glycosyltransferase n=1 Tax=Paenibacillus sp. FSL H8-0048 TaxID=2954508 RepID=UPI0030F9CD7A